MTATLSFTSTQLPVFLIKQPHYSLLHLSNIHVPLYKLQFILLTLTSHKIFFLSGCISATSYFLFVPISSTLTLSHLWDGCPQLVGEQCMLNGPHRHLPPLCDRFRQLTHQSLHCIKVNQPTHTHTHPNTQTCHLLGA